MAPITINASQIINADRTQVFLSISSILILLFDIYTQTKIKIAIISNNKNGMELVPNNKDHTMAIIELKEIIIINNRINGYVF